MPMIDAAIHDAVMACRRTNAATDQGSTRLCAMVSKLGPLRPAGSVDQYGVPKATE
jgi:hypothetical protein